MSQTSEQNITYITWYHEEVQQHGNKQNQRMSSLGSDWLNAAQLTLYNIPW